MLNAIPDYIVAIDTRYRIKRVNQPLAERLECSSEGLRGELCYRYICKASHPPISCPHAKILSDGKVHMSEKYDNRLGSALRITSAPLHNDGGRLIGAVHIIRNYKREHYGQKNK
jgi:transcriptional regulator with PAS, ATPase and Fis domain